MTNAATTLTRAAPAQRHPSLDEVIDALCEVSRELEISAALPELMDTTGRVKVCPRRARLVACLDAGVTELTRLKHERRQGEMGRRW